MTGKEAKRLCLAVDNMQVDQVEADLVELAVAMGLRREVCVCVCGLLWNSSVCDPVKGGQQIICEIRKG